LWVPIGHSEPSRFGRDFTKTGVLDASTAGAKLDGARYACQHL
jgi:hypothetical protein